MSRSVAWERFGRESPAAHSAFACREPRQWRLLVVSRHTASAPNAAVDCFCTGGPYTGATVSDAEFDRRRLLELFGATATVAGLGGCSGTQSDEAGTVNPQLRGTPSETRSEQYGSGEDALRRARHVVLQNHLLRDKTATVTLSDGDTTVFSESVRIAAGERGRVGRPIAAVGEYRLRVTTPDGRETTADWIVRPDAGNLGIEIDDGLSIRDRYTGPLARQLIGGDSTLVGDGSDRTVLRLDNEGTATTVRLTLATDDGSELGALRLRVPARAQLLLPLAAEPRPTTARVSAGGTVATYRWQPLTDERLDVSVSPGPTFRCDPRWRDLVVRNQTERAQTTRVRIGGTAGVVFEGRIPVPAGGTRRRFAAVGPTAQYTSTVQTDDDSESYQWPGCPPVGPVLVVVDSDGISVSVRPRDG